MNLKLALVRSLLRLYPTTWRVEYGEELAALLVLRPITPYVVIDVILSATRERLRSAAPWKTCGTTLFAFTLIGILVNNTVPPSRAAYALYLSLWETIVVLAGCWTFLKERGRSPSLAAIKAALLGIVPEAVALTLWTAGVFRPIVTIAPGPLPLLEIRLALTDMTLPTAPHPSFAIIPLAAAALMLQAWILGFFGGMLGQAISFLAPRFRSR